MLGVPGAAGEVSAVGAAGRGDGEQGAGSGQGVRGKVPACTGWDGQGWPAGAAPSPRAPSWRLPADSAPLSKWLPGDVLVLPTAVKAAAPAWSPRGHFGRRREDLPSSAYSILTFCRDGHRLGGALQKRPSSWRTQESPQPSPRHHRRSFGREYLFSSGRIPKRPLS